MNLRPFQIILFGVFLALAIGGLIMFSVFRGFGNDLNPYGASVEIWGTLDRAAFNEVLLAMSDADDNFKVVSYVELNTDTFVRDLTNAIAEGRGPDAVVLSSDLLISERAKLYPIPYETLTERTLRDTYVDGAEIFSLFDGTYGFPLAVDPLVLYWNRDLYASAGLATPPTTWEQIVARDVPLITARGQSFTITRSALAFGEYQNVSHASAVLLTLLLQSGSFLIVEDIRGYVVALNQSESQIGRPPLDASLDFYTQFANPARPTYTWNRSLARDRNAFLSGDLALYFGLASEYEEIEEGNVNLNFDVAPVPQGSGAVIKKSYGTFYSLAILRSADNPEGAFAALARLSSADSAEVLSERLRLAPVHRTILEKGSIDPFEQTIYTAALIARGFLNPEPVATESVVRTMIEDITSGREGINKAVTDAIARFNQILR